MSQYPYAGYTCGGFTFLFVNLFDTIGTLLGVASKIGIQMSRQLPQIRRPFLQMLWVQLWSCSWNQHGSLMWRVPPVWLWRAFLNRLSCHLMFVLALSLHLCS